MKKKCLVLIGICLSTLALNVGCGEVPEPTATAIHTYTPIDDEIVNNVKDEANDLTNVKEIITKAIENETDNYEGKYKLNLSIPLSKSKVSVSTNLSMQRDGDTCYCKGKVKTKILGMSMSTNMQEYIQYSTSGTVVYSFVDADSKWYKTVSTVTDDGIFGIVDNFSNVSLFENATLMNNDKDKEYQIYNEIVVSDVLDYLNRIDEFKEYSEYVTSKEISECKEKIKCSYKIDKKSFRIVSVQMDASDFYKYIIEKNIENGKLSGQTLDDDPKLAVEFEKQDWDNVSIKIPQEIIDCALLR